MTDFSELRSRFIRRWVCMVSRSGYHNGASCLPGEAHGGNWRCGWRWEVSMTDAEFDRWFPPAVPEEREDRG